MISYYYWKPFRNCNNRRQLWFTCLLHRKCYMPVVYSTFFDIICHNRDLVVFLVITIVKKDMFIYLWNIIDALIGFALRLKICNRLWSKSDGSNFTNLHFFTYKTAWFSLINVIFFQSNWNQNPIYLYLEYFCFE